MNIILITTKGRFVPKDSDNRGFSKILQTRKEDVSIFKKECDDYVVYVTKCIADESQSQIKKHNDISDILEIVKKDAADTYKEISKKYLIAHDGDLLEFTTGKYGRYGLFHENDFNNTTEENRFYKCFKEWDIYIFQHEPICKMFSQVVAYIRKDFTNEQINYALEIIKNEA